MLRTKTRKEKIKLQDIGLYLRLIQMEYSPKDNKEMAKLISEQFNVKCTEGDVNTYEAMHIYQEDFEKESKIVESGFNIFNEMQII